MRKLVLLEEFQRKKLKATDLKLKQFAFLLADKLGLESMSKMCKPDKRQADNLLLKMDK
jgi:hypothetical protein